jgi:hypothetical protein
MEYKKVIFETKQEAESFKQFLSMKGLRYVLISAPNQVTVKDFISEQDMYNLIYKFGRWY